MNYRVIKDIDDGWEISAKIGDILHVQWWEGAPTLMKGKKAVCDKDSKLANENCELIKEESANEEVR
ncbi:hypothetical protein [Paenibacillus sp. NEAU-GSW1]|uniref:hypothetical protein n=1 Tax=Paenibacillus sp. NEAU-GSW1 TaxID=2682486 RepID=UPI0012E24ABA|nr:hypothetical protein [Paenibacillus sp. NEAU-GSW1]MUT66045.1 hypothetical protein [Paenibacillus sp. NEAU-GSW1]